MNVFDYPSNKLQSFSLIEQAYHSVGDGYVLSSTMYISDSVIGSDRLKCFVLLYWTRWPSFLLCFCSNENKHLEMDIVSVIFGGKACQLFFVLFSLNEMFYSTIATTTTFVHFY